MLMYSGGPQGADISPVRRRLSQSLLVHRRQQPVPARPSTPGGRSCSGRGQWDDDSRRPSAGRRCHGNGDTRSYGGGADVDVRPYQRRDDRRRLRRF